MLKLIFIALYIGSMLVVGYLCRHRTKTVGDFFLGGRTIGPWMSAFAYGATYFSAVLFIGYAGKLGWGFGLHALWIVVGNVIVGGYLAWKVLGPRTRIMTARLNAMTMPEFLAARYDCNALKFISAIVVFIFLVPYSASIFMGLSYLFDVNLNISYPLAIALMAILTGIYLIMGGYSALVITDTIQSIVMVVGVFFMVFTLVNHVGGFGQATMQLMSAENAPGLHTPSGIPGWLTLASLVVVTSFGPWGLPHMVQKFYSIKSEGDINRAAIVCSLFSLIVAFGAYYTGALTHLFYDQPPQNIDELIPRMLTDHTPPIIATIILLLVVSASMSSLSSLVLVSSSAIAIDLYSGYINPNASKKQVVILFRVLCGIFVLLSLLLALRPPVVIVNLMVISWGALAGAFVGPYLYGLYWRRTTKTAAIVSLIAGVIISVSLYNILGKPGIPLAGAISMLIPLILVPAVSLITKPFSREHLDRVFGTE